MLSGKEGEGGRRVGVAVVAVERSNAVLYILFYFYLCFLFFFIFIIFFISQRVFIYRIYIYIFFFYLPRRASVNQAGG